MQYSRVEEIMDIKQASKFLNMKVSRIRTAILNKEIPFFKIGSLVRFEKKDLEFWIENLKKQMPKY